MDINDIDSVRSKIINYWDAQPCNIKHSNFEIGTHEYWEQISSKRFFVEPHILDLANFHSWSGKRVLEIGCGIGSDAVEFVKNGAEYVGLDISQKSVDLAKSRFQLYGYAGDFYTIDASSKEEMNKLGSFDLVYACGVLHHYPKIEDIINNVFDLLNSNGEFRFLVYSKNSWKFAMIQKGLDQYESQANCPYAIAFDKNEIYDLLKGKFDIIDIKQDHCFMYNVEKYKKNIYELEPWFSAMNENMRAAIKEYLGWHYLVKAKKI